MEKLPLLVDEAKALEVLGVRPATLRAMVRTGMLDQVKYERGRVRRYYLDELMSARQARLQGRKEGINVQEQIALLMSKVQKLDRDLHLMAQQVGLPHIGYSPVDATLIQAYQIAVALRGSMKEKRPTVRLLNQWLSVVPLFTETEYRRLAKLYQGDEHPWHVFYRVTDEMRESIRVHYNLEGDDQMAVMKTRLLLCLDRVRVAALVFLAVVNPREDPVRRMNEVLQSPGGESSLLEAERLMQDLQLEKFDPDAAVSEMFDSVQANAPIPASGTLSHLDLRIASGRPRCRRSPGA